MKHWVYAMGLGTAIALLPAIASPAATPFEAARKRLGCLVGDPDGSFQGDRALSRFEFAAGLVACSNLLLMQFTPPQAGAAPGEGMAQDSLATQEEVKTIWQTQQELSHEMQQLQERVRRLSE